MKDGYINQKILFSPPSTITFAFSLLINLNSLLLTHYYTLPK